MYHVHQEYLYSMTCTNLNCFRDPDNLDESVRNVAVTKYRYDQENDTENEKEPFCFQRSISDVFKANLENFCHCFYSWSGLRYDCSNSMKIRGTWLNRRYSKSILTTNLSNPGHNEGEISLTSRCHNNQIIYITDYASIIILITELRELAQAILRTKLGNKEIASFRSYQLSTSSCMWYGDKISNMHGSYVE